jgi:hypothetical protein
MSVNEMTLDQTTLGVLSAEEMEVDKITIDLMPADEMTIDEKSRHHPSFLS